MPESIPLRSQKKPLSTRAHARDGSRSNDISLQPGSGTVSRSTSPFTNAHSNGNGHDKQKDVESPRDSLEFDDWDEQDVAMPSDLRKSQEEAERDSHRAPLLGRHPKDEDEGIEDSVGTLGRSTHTFHERDPVSQAKYETRKKYTYAAITLALSLVSFTVQTETAVYIQHELKWEKPYCMLYIPPLPLLQFNH